MSDWSLAYDGFNPEEEGLREALCTLGNGRFATRGAGEEAEAGDFRYPGVYIAGVYNRRISCVHGKRLENEDLVNAPNWLSVNFRVVGGDWLDLNAVEILSYRQELDLRRGMLLRSFQIRDQAGRVTTVSGERFVHMSKPRIAALKISIRLENWSGPIEIRSALDGRVENRGVARYRDLEGCHLEPVEALSREGVLTLVMETNQSQVRVAEAARHSVVNHDGPEKLEKRRIEKAAYVADEFAVEAHKGNTVHFEKIVSVITSRDHAISQPGQAAGDAVRRSGSFQELCESHTHAWESLWESFGMEISVADGGEEVHINRIIRLHTFHLLQTLSPNTIGLDAGAPARGLHGEAYRGHVFWDELFVLPFYNLRLPEVTRALLKYRFRRLDAARYAAREAGYDGAMYPWQSGSTGREESQALHLNPRSGRWVHDQTHLQRHVNAAIAYNIWQYFQATGDLEFLSFFGAEMLFEIARFWASASTYNPVLDRYEIANVMGPDEYHDRLPGAEKPGLKNNAYTNIMAAWTLWRAVELTACLPADQFQRLTWKLRLRDAEFSTWDKISRRLMVVMTDDGVISQFEGYDDLEEFDWESCRMRHGDIQRLDRILEAEGDSPNKYKLSKQADVLMLFFLFSAEELQGLFERLDYPFEGAMIPRNIEYYLNRTSHGSTLSRTTHAWVLSRSDRTQSWSLLKQALESDVSDIQGGTTQEGVHLGAMAGAVDILQRCYIGLETRAGVLWANPRLPDEIQRIRMPLRYRQRAFELDVTRRRFRVSVGGGAGPALPLGVGDRIYELAAGETRTFEILPEMGATRTGSVRDLAN